MRLKRCKSQPLRSAQIGGHFLILPVKKGIHFKESQYFIDRTIFSYVNVGKSDWESVFMGEGIIIIWGVAETVRPYLLKLIKFPEIRFLI